MQTETPNSTKPSKSSPAKHRRRRRHRRHNPEERPVSPPTFRHETSAGGIIYRRKNGGVDVFFIKDPFNRWTFPKGHAEPGEALSDAAIRECDEEAGLKDLKLIAPLGRTTFRFRREGTVIQKTVHFFLLEAPPNAKEHFLTREEMPEGKEPIFEGKWVRLNQAFMVSSYTNSDRLLIKALRIISSRNIRPQRPPRA